MTEPAPTSILLVDDEPSLREPLAEYLSRQGFVVREADSAAQARTLIAQELPDLALLDIMMPGEDGLSLCRHLVESRGLPTILLTAKGEAMDRIIGLEIGADDYVTKPFEPRELLVRIRNLLRRGRSDPAARPAAARFARFGPWRLDLQQRRLVAPDDSLVMLSSAEFRLLSRFIEEPNVVLSRETLVPERRATAAFDRSIDLQVSRLRQKLATLDGGDELILTVRGEGYVLASGVEHL